MALIPFTPSQVKLPFAMKMSTRIVDFNNSIGVTALGLGIPTAPIATLHTHEDSITDALQYHIRR